MSRRPEYVPDLSFHLAHRSRAFPSAASLSLVVGDVAVRLRGLGGDRVEMLRRRYGIFCRAAAVGPVCDIRVSLAGLPGFLEIQKPDELYRIDTRWEGDRLMACSYEWAGWLDPSRGEGGLALAEGALAGPRAFDRSIENFLRVAFAHLIVARGGFLLHAAGLVRDGRAFLFFGPSGSGKTTVTALSPGALILSDDLTMVARTAPGEYRACSVPFRGLFAPEPATAESWPLAGFFRLVQDRTDRLVAVEGARAVGELVGSLPFVMERPGFAGRAIDAVAAAARKVPVFRLHFRKERTFWQVIEARCPAVDGFSASGGIRP